MPRRRTVSDAGVSMDSLMDAMTNVVAVLILVLLLVQVDVKQTVQKFLDELRPATPEEVAEAVVARGARVGDAVEGGAGEEAEDAATVVDRNEDNAVLLRQG